jgi:hypothetical protein
MDLLMGTDTLFTQINSNLQYMDLPINRRDASRGHNLKWLLQNLGARNSNHTKYPETIALLARAGRASHLLRACDVPQSRRVEVKHATQGEGQRA